MQFKNYLYKIVLVFITLLSIQVAPMQSENQTTAGACVQCNKFNQQVQNLPCDHPICLACNEKVNDDNANLGLPGICKMCRFIYKTGDVITDGNGNEINKNFFNPALEIPMTEGLAVAWPLGCALGAVVGNHMWGNTKSVMLCGLASGGITSAFWNHLVKVKIIQKSLTIAEGLKQQAPILSNVMKKRLKLFQKKHFIYSCIAALPSSGVYYLLSNKMAQQARNRDSGGYLLNGSIIAASLILPMIAVDVWGNRYDSIPKLK